MSGQGYFRDAQNRLIRVRRGDLVLVEAQSYQEYGIWPRSSLWHAHWVHFDAQPHWCHWLPLSRRSGLHAVSYAHVPSRSVQQQISELFFELQFQRTRPEIWRHALALNLLERILILAHAGSETARTADARITRVLRAIETRSPDAPSSAELSALAGLSPSRLAYLFKQHTGMSLLAVINRVRLRTAHFALQQQGMTLADVAERTGFQSPYSFSNWFIKQTGQRPGEYRRRSAERRLALRTEEPWILPRSQSKRSR